MRILFAMVYPGYLRYFDATVLELAARGHDVEVVFDSPHKQSEGLAALDDAPENVCVLDGFPRRGDLLERAAREVRRTVDYVRYLHPIYRNAAHLRQRVGEHVPAGLGFLRRMPHLPVRLLRILLRGLLLFEHAIPSAPRIEAFLELQHPDVLVVSPLVMSASRQTDLVKSARALGIPTVLAVGSWDHLTTKGLIRVMPDRVLVWNHTQREEAIALHGVDPQRIVITGAQPFDRWFTREPELAHAAFCARVGLPAQRPFILFVGSTASISETDAEQRFVRRWLGELRRSLPAELRDVSVLVRPHPYNPGTWKDADLSELGPVAVWPRDGANIVAEENRSDYFHSLAHCSAVVGVNTSAMIEAAVVGCSVHTVRAPEFAETQSGTVHFGYVLAERGGPVLGAETLREHVAQLEIALRDSGPALERNRRFIDSFVRPCGVERPCVPLVADAIERTGALVVQAEPAAAPALAPLRAVLRVIAVALLSRDPRGRAKLRARTVKRLRARRMRMVRRVRSRLSRLTARWQARGQAS